MRVKILLGGGKTHLVVTKTKFTESWFEKPGKSVNVSKTYLHVGKYIVATDHLQIAS